MKIQNPNANTHLEHAKAVPAVKVSLSICLSTNLHANTFNTIIGLFKVKYIDVNINKYKIAHHHSQHYRCTFSKYVQTSHTINEHRACLLRGSYYWCSQTLFLYSSIQIQTENSMYEKVSMSMCLPTLSRTLKHSHAKYLTPAHLLCTKYWTGCNTTHILLAFGFSHILASLNASSSRVHT